MSGPRECTPRDMARAYAEVGWPVFPLARGEKIPALPAVHPAGDPLRATCKGECGRLGHGFNDATTDLRQIEEWWGRHPGWNVGIATGAPGPDVLDVDNHGAAGNGYAAMNRLKRAGLCGGQQAIVTTPSTGYHLYYKGSGQPNGTIRDQHIDFRGKGGYVVAPPSKTADGAYVVVEHHPGEPATISWREVHDVLDPPELQAQRQLRPTSPATTGGRGNEGRVDRVSGFVADGKDHDRNYRVFWAGRELEWAGQLDRAAEDRLVSAAVSAGLRGGEAEARRSIASGRAYAQSHSPESVRRLGLGPARPASDRQASNDRREAGGDGRPFGSSVAPSAEHEREAI
jgi:hypothetical protein